MAPPSRNHMRQRRLAKVEHRINIDRKTQPPVFQYQADETA